MGYETWRELLRPELPAAGSPFTFKVGSKTYDMVITAQGKFTTSAVVANRTPYLAYLDGDGREFARFSSGVVIAASDSTTETWGISFGTLVTSGPGFTTAGLTGVLLPPGYELQLGMGNMDVGDTITDVSLWVHRAPTGEVGQPTGARPYAPELVLLT